MSTSRELAVRYFNAAWDLIDRETLSDEETREMLRLAVASRRLWAEDGQPSNLIAGDWQIGHAAAKAGLGEMALMFSLAALEQLEHSDEPLWLHASCQEGVGRAYAVLGDKAKALEHLDRASEILSRCEDPDDAAVIGAQIESARRLLG